MPCFSVVGMVRFAVLHTGCFSLGEVEVQAVEPKQWCSVPLGQDVCLSLTFSSVSPCSVFSVCLLHSYESSAVILPHTPRLTHFPTVSGSPASLADSMQQKLAGPRRRRPQNPSAM